MANRRVAKDKHGVAKGGPNDHLHPVSGKGGGKVSPGGEAVRRGTHPNAPGVVNGIGANGLPVGKGPVAGVYGPNGTGVGGTGMWRGKQKYKAYKQPPVINPKGYGSPLMPRRGLAKLETFANDAGPQLHSNILVTPSALSKMGTLIRCCTEEIGWLGTVQDHGDVLVIDNILLFEQKVHSSTTEISADTLGDFATEFLDSPPDGMSDDEAMDYLNRVRFWGHSHVSMGVTPSLQDDDTMIDVFVPPIAGTAMPWFIRGIGNKRGDLAFDIYYADLGFALIDVPWTIGDLAVDQGTDELIAEMTAKTKRGVLAAPYAYGGYAGYGGHGGYGGPAGAWSDFFDPNGEFLDDEDGIDPNAAEDGQVPVVMGASSTSTEDELADAWLAEQEALDNAK